MIFYCCRHINGERDLISNYVRTKEELTKVCQDVRRQGFFPVKTVIRISADGVRTELSIK